LFFSSAIGAGRSFCLGFENGVNEVLFAHGRNATEAHLLGNLFEFRKLFVLKFCNFHVLGRGLAIESAHNSVQGLIMGWHIRNSCPF
jgi:hypothetical protein